MRSVEYRGSNAREPNAPHISAPVPEFTAPVSRLWRRLELPTWLVGVAVYGGWGLTTWFYHDLPWWLVLPLGAWFVSWHGSLQHEALHGHPTRWRWVNALFAGPPLWLWLPYLLYQESHITHHNEDVLTSPTDDPESFYVTPVAWARMNFLLRGLYRFSNTVPGRLTFGPLNAYRNLALSEWHRLRARDYSHVSAWLIHFVAAAALLYWVLGVVGIPLWAYIVFFAYPGLSLTMLRSFAEHRPAREPAHRSVVVETSLPMRLLYLNNNYHAPHHAMPDLAWYDVGAYYRANKGAFLQRNGGYLFRGYGEQLRDYFFRPKDQPVHPAGLAPTP
jgi:fatty acid desaturase